MARFVSTILLVSLLVGCGAATPAAPLSPSRPPSTPTSASVTALPQSATSTLMPLPSPQSSSPVVPPLPTSAVTPRTPSSVSVATAPSRGALTAFWAPQEDVQSSMGEFAVKELSVTTSYVHLLYAMRTPLPGPPLLTLSISPGACPNATTHAPAPVPTVADFGRLGDVEVGVVTFPWINQPGQVFTLAIAPPGFTAAIWHLPVLIQTAPAANVGHTGVPSLDPQSVNAFPEILVSEGRVVTSFTPGVPGPSTGRFNGYFAHEEAGMVRHYVPQVFFVIEADGTVRQLTADAFVALGGLTSGAYGTVGPIVLPSPYPPTATNPGRVVSASPPPTVCG